MNDGLFFHALILLASLGVVVASAMLLVQASITLANYLKIPKYIIGLTLVAMGTSSPELVVSLMSAIKNEGDMAVGNVFGSNMANLGIGLSLCFVLARSRIRLPKTMLWVEIPVIVLMHMSFWGFAQDFRCERWEGLVLIGLTIAVLYGMYKNYGLKDMLDMEEHLDVRAPAKHVWKGLLFPFCWICVACAVLYFSSKICIDQAVAVATLLGVNKRIIAATVLAIGTSAPEFTTVIISTLKAHHGISLGTILGSNIINIGMVLGLSMATAPFQLSSPAYQIDLVSSVLLTLLLIPLIIFKHIPIRGFGCLLFLAYLAYAYYSFVLTVS